MVIWISRGGEKLDKDLLKPEEVASILKISKYTVYEMVKRGDLQAIRIGRKMRFDPETIVNFKQGDKIPNEQSVNNNTEQPLTTLGVDYHGANNGHPLLFLGSHDLAMEVLANEIRDNYANLQFFTAFTGSMDGLLNLYFGKCDIAGCHLYDEESRQYNVPFVKRIFPGEKIHIIHFVNRNIGWIVPKGNPKQLTSWQDVAGTDLKIVNRQKGSGTRVLLDYYIKKLNLSGSDITGYDDVERTHIGAASKIARGMADAALGTESAAKALGLDFIFLTEEKYDFVMKHEFYESSQGQAFIRILQSPRIIEKITQLGGYNIQNIGILVGEN